MTRLTGLQIALIPGRSTRSNDPIHSSSRLEILSVVTGIVTERTVELHQVTLVNATELLKCTIKKLQEEMAGLEEPKSYWPPVTDKVAASIGFMQVKYSHLLDDLELELETLALVIPRGGWDDKPPLEFRLRSPGLHRLYFVNVSPLPQDKFSNVTYIGLFDCHRVLLSDLVRLLGECPILEDLIIASHIHGSTNPTRAVPLLRLRRLAVAWLEDHTLATFLSHVEMALTTAVQIQLHGALRDSPLFHALKGIPVMQSVSRLLLGTSLDRYSFMAHRIIAQQDSPMFALGSYPAAMAQEYNRSGPLGAILAAPAHV
ncbi:predicted protein [Postia placenta Mad-698-R]|nr:predicted protein [Postia placenta Mad-698-R]